jgi:hypothetical protein
MNEIAPSETLPNKIGSQKSMMAAEEIIIIYLRQSHTTYREQ